MTTIELLRRIAALGRWERVDIVPSGDGKGVELHLDASPIWVDRTLLNVKALKVVSKLGQRVRYKLGSIDELAAVFEEPKGCA